MTRYTLDTDTWIALIGCRPESACHQLLPTKHSGAIDRLIGLHAFYLLAVLVTNNLREFERIP